MNLTNVLIKDIVPPMIELPYGYTSISSYIHPWSSFITNGEIAPTDNKDYIIVSTDLLLKLSNWTDEPDEEDLHAIYQSAIQGYFNFSYTYLANYLVAYSRARELTTDISLFFYKELKDQDAIINVYDIYCRNIASIRGNSIEFIYTEVIPFLLTLFLGIIILLLIYERAIFKDSYPMLNLLSSRGVKKGYLFTKILKKEAKAHFLFSQIFAMLFSIVFWLFFVTVFDSDSIFSESIFVDFIFALGTMEVIIIPFFLLMFLIRIYFKNREILGNKEFLWYREHDIELENKQRDGKSRTKKIRRIVTTTFTCILSVVFPLVTYALYKNDIPAKWPVNTIYIMKYFFITSIVIFYASLAFLIIQLIRNSNFSFPSLKLPFISSFSKKSHKKNSIKVLLKKLYAKKSSLSKVLFILILCNVFAVFWYAFYLVNTNYNGYYFGCDIELTINDEIYSKICVNNSLVDYNNSSIVNGTFITPSLILNKLKYIEGVDIILPYYCPKISGPAYAGKNITLHLLPINSLLKLISKYPDRIPGIRDRQISSLQKLKDGEILSFEYMRIKGLTKIGDIYTLKQSSLKFSNYSEEISFKVSGFISHFNYHKLYAIGNLSEVFLENFPITHFYIKLSDGTNITEVVSQIREILPPSLGVERYCYDGEITKTMKIRANNDPYREEKYKIVINYIRFTIFVIASISSVIVLLIFQEFFKGTRQIRSILVARGEKIKKSLLYPMFAFMLKFTLQYIVSFLLLLSLLVGSISAYYIINHGLYIIFILPKISLLVRYISAVFGVLSVPTLISYLLILKTTSAEQIIKEGVSFESSITKSQ